MCCRKIMSVLICAVLACAALHGAQPVDELMADWLAQDGGLPKGKTEAEYRKDCLARRAKRLKGVAEFARRFTGSSDLYQNDGRHPSASINFVTCHDGFTLNDVVSYNVKHNESNGEGNRDGNDQNLSWNGGVESGRSWNFSGC